MGASADGIAMPAGSLADLDIINESVPLEVVAQAESTRSYFLAQTLESTRTVPMVSAKLPIDTGAANEGSTAAPEGTGSSEDPTEGGDDSDESDSGAASIEASGADRGEVSAESTVVGSFSYRGITYAIEPGGDSVAIVAADYAQLPADFIEAQTIVLPSQVTADGIDYYSVTRIADGSFASLTVAVAQASMLGNMSTVDMVSDRSDAHETNNASEIPSLDIVSTVVELTDKDSTTSAIAVNEENDVSSRIVLDGTNDGNHDEEALAEIDAVAEEVESPIGITTITIPESITVIEANAFTGFDTLQYLVVSPDSLNYSMYDGCLYDKPLTSLLLIPGGRLGAVRISSTTTMMSEDVSSHCAYLTAFVTDADSAASHLLEANGFYNAEGEKIDVIIAPDNNDSTPFNANYFEIIQADFARFATEFENEPNSAPEGDVILTPAIVEEDDLQETPNFNGAEILERIELEASAESINAPTSGALPLKGNLGNTDQQAAGWSFDVATGLLSIWSSGSNTVQVDIYWNEENQETIKNAYWGPWRPLVTAVDTTRLGGATKMSSWFCLMRSLTDISKLVIPDGSKGDAPNSFDEMFVSCTSLTEIPSTFKFPSTACSLVSTFWGCSKLSKLADTFSLPNYAGTLTVACMFFNCKSLTRLPASLRFDRSILWEGTRPVFGWDNTGDQDSLITTYYPGELSWLVPSGQDPVEYWRTKNNRKLVATAGALPTVADSSNTNRNMAGWTFDLDSGLLTVKSAQGQSVSLPWSWSDMNTLNTTHWGPLRSQVKAIDTRELSGARTWNAWFCSMPNLSDLSRLIIPNGSRGGVVPKNFQECFVNDKSIKAIPSTFILPSQANIFAAMFYGCSGLETIYEGFTIPTSSASVNINTMFYGCPSLVELPASLNIAATNFDGVGNTFSLGGSFATGDPLVTYTNNLLPNMAPSGQDPVEYWQTKYNRKLIALRGALPTTTNSANADPDIAGWKFDRASGLLTISSAVNQSVNILWNWGNWAVPAAEHWGPLRSQVKAVDTTRLSGATNMHCWFALMYSLSDLTRFIIPDGSKGVATTAFGETFVNCSSLTTLPSNVVFPPTTNHLASTFWGCKNLSFIYEGFTLPRAASALNTNTMFWGCTSLVSLPASLDLSSSNLSNPANAFGFTQNDATVVPLRTYYSGDLSKLAPAGQDPVQYWLEKYHRELVPLASNQALFVVQPVGKTLGWEPFGDLGTISSGGIVTRPADDPYTYGYPFAGWYTDATCSTPFDFSNAITGPVVIYGKFGAPILNATVPLGTGDATFAIDRAFREARAVVDGELKDAFPLRVESRTPVDTVFAAASSLDADKAQLLFGDNADSVELVIRMTPEEVRFALDGGENDSIAILEGASEANKIIALDGDFTLDLNEIMTANRDEEETLEGVANIVWTISIV